MTTITADTTACIEHNSLIIISNKISDTSSWNKPLQVKTAPHQLLSVVPEASAYAA